MLRVYTKIPKDQRIINFLDIVFDENLSLIISNYDDIDSKCLKYIDKAKLVHRGSEVWVKKGTAFYPLKKISTGAKTCMLVHHLPKMDGLLSINGCGNNALTALFTYVKNSENDLYISHVEFNPDNKDLVGVPICVNNKPNCTISDLWHAIS